MVQMYVTAAVHCNFSILGLIMYAYCRKPVLASEKLQQQCSSNYLLQLSKNRNKANKATPGTAS